MKKYLFFSIAAVLMMTVSCQKTSVSNKAQDGFLSLGGMVLEVDDAVETKAVAASNYYVITILDADDKVCLTTTYKDVKDNDNKITLPAGDYKISVSSSDEETPKAEWEFPVYGVEREFSIVAGEVTEIGDLTCTLTQCKVTVDYNEDFLASVTGQGKTTVTIIDGHSLEYGLTSKDSYVRNAGYFVVEGSTMTVVFQGSIDGKNQKMTKAFNNVAPKQWRQVRFIKKVDEQGNATFDIVINQLVSDLVLNEALTAKNETTIGDDPDAPKDDGGISLSLDYEAGCDPEITDLENIRIVPVATRDMKIRFKASVPNGVKKFTVNIDSDNSSFLAAVEAADARELDLISPSAANEIIFQVVPFPHGESLIGATELDFNLDTAQDAILLYQGTHKFTMNIVDNQGCRNQIPVIMVVE